MARGLDNQAIADALAIEQSTVENHINSIYSKLDSSRGLYCHHFNSHVWGAQGDQSAACSPDG